MRSKRLALAACLLAACVAAPADKNAPRPGNSLGLPPARADLVFPEGDAEVTVGWLVDELGRLTGQDLVVNEGLRHQLARWNVSPLRRTPVPAGEVYAFVGSFLVTEGIALVPLKGGARPVLWVHAADRRSSPAPLVVDAADLDELERHPALFCQVGLFLENIDSRQLQTQLRQLLVDTTGMQQAVPTGERGLLLRGTGANLLSIARSLRLADELSRALPRPDARPARATREAEPAELRKAAASIDLPPARGPLAFPADVDEVTLAWLLDELGRVTGVELAADQGTRTFLEQTSQRLESRAPVPAAEVYPFVESILLANGVTLAPLAGGTRPVLAVRTARDRRGGGDPAVLTLDVSALPDLEQHPALHCRVVVRLLNCDAREFHGQLRALVSGMDSMQATPAGGGALILEGPGAMLVGLVRAVREADEKNASETEGGVEERH